MDIIKDTDVTTANAVTAATADDAVGAADTAVAADMIADTVADAADAATADAADSDAAADAAGCAACGGRTTARGDDERRSLRNRLSRIEGQIRGIIGMIDRDAYCNDILIQSAAVSAAMNAFNRQLVASHIRHCIVREIRAGDDAVIDELIDTLGKLMK